MVFIIGECSLQSPDMAVPHNCDLAAWCRHPDSCNWVILWNLEKRNRERRYYWLYNDTITRSLFCLGYISGVPSRSPHYAMLILWTVDRYFVLDDNTVLRGLIIICGVRLSYYHPYFTDYYFSIFYYNSPHAYALLLRLMIIFLFFFLLIRRIRISSPVSLVSARRACN